MPRLIALEWDAAEARVVAARVGRGETVIEQAFSVDLTDSSSAPEGSLPSPQANSPNNERSTSRRADQSTGADLESRASQRITSALAARGLGRADALVAVGRASTQLQVLTIPPAPPEEMPDMVRFQAMRQFSSLGEDWPLDYTPLETADAASEQQSQNVLAAAISPARVKQIQETCAEAGLTPLRLALRPFAAASFLARSGHADDCILMVDMLTDEADITVMVDGQVVFLRTVRLPSSAPEEQQAQTVGREVRRTMAASQNQLGGRGVARIVLCGVEQNLGAVKSHLEVSLSLPVECFDPFGGLRLSRELAQSRPDFPGRFAPLLGMIADEGAGAAPAIDFLHPRKRPEPSRNRLRVGLWAGLAATIVLVLTVLVALRLRALDNEIAGLTAKSKSYDEPLKKIAELHERVGVVDEFEKGNVNWLDELYRIAEKVPPAEKVLFTEVNCKSGQIVLDAYADDPAVVTVLEEKLRDEKHEVQGWGVREDQRRNNYPWGFTEYIQVQQEDEE